MQRAVDTLYSDGLMTNFYSEFGTATNACVSGAKAFSGVLDTIRMSGKKSVKILEIGAGSFLSTNLNQMADNRTCQERGC